MEFHGLQSVSPILLGYVESHKRVTVTAGLTLHVKLPIINSNGGDYVRVTRQRCDERVGVDGTQ